MDQRPLSIAEFIGPLSLCSNTMDDQEAEFKAFTDAVTGDKKRRDLLKLAREGGDDADPKKGKKGKKGKKKGR